MDQGNNAQNTEKNQVKWNNADNFVLKPKLFV